MLKRLFSPKALNISFASSSMSASTSALEIGHATGNECNHSPVIELFTSQGCSSCPPADAVAIRLARDDPSLIILSYHVDYWDYLGWKDPHAATVYSQRQRSYASRLNERSVYTPQIIINGVHGMVSDRSNGTMLLSLSYDQLLITGWI